MPHDDRARGERVMQAARELGLRPERYPPRVRINGRSYTVAGAEAFLDGYRFGYRACRQDEPMHRQAVVDTINRQDGAQPYHG